MKLNEHLQFLAMMIPTLLLLIAATISIAFPAEASKHDYSYTLSQPVLAAEAAPQESADLP